MKAPKLRLIVFQQKLKNIPQLHQVLYIQVTLHSGTHGGHL